MQHESTQSTKAIAEAFTAISDHYSTHFLTAKTGTHFCFRRRFELVMEMTVGRTGAFLDCAVGPAEITAEVLCRGKFDRAQLVDISPLMIAKAQARLKSVLPAENLAGVSFVTGDLFEVIPSLRDQRFDLIFCIGLIAHTGRLDQILSNLKAVLSPGGQILVQSTLLDHWGTKVVRRCSAKRYERKYGYRINYFYHNDIVQACNRNGLRIVSTRRFCAGAPFGDRIWARANYYFEQLFAPLAPSLGSEALYLLESDTAV